MALKSRRYECPECVQQFDILKDDTDPPPSFCPLCGADVRGEQPIPYFARAGKATDGSLDKVYRKMEESSYHRAEMAAEMVGGKAEDFANLRMTNMKDNTRPGETSFIPPSPSLQPPPVAAMPGQVGLATSQMIRQSGGSVGQGVMDTFRRDHRQRASAMQRAGEMGRHSGK